MKIFVGTELESGSILFNFEGLKRNLKREHGLMRRAWGYSSAGRAPALQAGGQEFEPPYLHQYGLIAQVVRARA